MRAILVKLNCSGAQSSTHDPTDRGHLRGKDVARGRCSGPEQWQDERVLHGKAERTWMAASSSSSPPAPFSSDGRPVEFVRNAG